MLIKVKYDNLIQFAIALDREANNVESVWVAVAHARRMIESMELSIKSNIDDDLEKIIRDLKREQEKLRNFATKIRMVVDRFDMEDREIYKSFEDTHLLMNDLLSFADTSAEEQSEKV